MTPLDEKPYLKKAASMHNTISKIGQRYKMFSPRIGTPIYRAPDILQRSEKYTESIDMWSAGCCIYFMLVGKPPFSELNKMSTLNALIKDGNFMRNRERYRVLSPLAKDLIESLICKDPNRRLTVQQAAEHPWLNNGHKKEDASGQLLLSDESSLSSEEASEDGSPTEKKK